MSRGYLVWQGKSRLDNKTDIVLILTTYTENVKTGRLVQSWVLVKDTPPIEASQTGKDFAICGNCIHRGRANGEHAVGRSCYVNLIFGGPLSVWKYYHKGLYTTIKPTRRNLKFLSGQGLRMASYGDPLAVPLSIWTKLASVATMHTGYTHSWKTLTKRQHKIVRSFLMASVDNEYDYKLATSLGYRTYRTSIENKALAGEILCPASKEAGRLTTCDNCNLCNGLNGNPNRPNIYLPLHGSPPAMANGKRNLIEVQ